MPTSSKSGPFVILFQGRSGSTYLVEGLSAHPLIRCEIERLVSLRKFGGDAQLTWANEYFESFASQFDAIGFKAKLDDILNQDAFSSLLRSRNAKVVILTRRNLPKVVVSWMNAERIFATTGDWNLYPPAHGMTPFVVDPQLFDRRLRLVEEGRKRLGNYVSELGLSTLNLFYEDILLDQSAAFRRVFSFLGVVDMPVIGNCVKATSDDLRDVILNYEEIRTQYLASKYQPMIEEVLRS